MDKEVNVENEINLESTEYNRLFAKMTHYSNTYFPICDFLNDIKNNKEPNFQKLNAYNDLEKIFDLFIFFYKGYTYLFECFNNGFNGMSFERYIASNILKNSSLKGKAYYKKEDEYTHLIEQAIKEVKKYYYEKIEEQFKEK